MRATPLGMRLFAKPAVAAGITGSAFDPAYKAAEFTLSNSNRTATQSGTTTGNSLVRGTVNHGAASSGLFFFEIQVVTLGTASSMDVGLPYSDQTTGDFIHNNGPIAYVSDGRVIVTGTTAGTGTAFSSGIIGYLVDASTKKAYVRLNGTDQVSCNMNALTGGFDISAFFASFPFYPAISCGAGTGAQAILNTGGPFVYPPSSYTPWS